MNAPRTLALRWYDVAWWLMTPLVLGYLLWRSVRQPEYRQGWAERWALDDSLQETAQRLPGQRLVWIHAVSVGETRAADPLVKALKARYPDIKIVFTHMTPTGKQAGIELFGDRVVRRYLPYDMAWTQRRFLQTLRPDLGLIMETELWPNLIHAAKCLSIPVALVNARLSEKSLRRGLKRQALLGTALQQLDLVLAQSQEDAQRIKKLAARSVQVIGNLKFDHHPDPAKHAAGLQWRDAKTRPTVLVASSRDGEEQALLTAIAAHSQSGSVAWWWVPRHPQRFEAVWQCLSVAARNDLVRRTDESFEKHQAQAWMVLGDSMGELAAYYARSDVVVMGGSVGPFGSQNLIEPCAQARPVILGPSVFNFASAAHEAIHAGAAVQCLTPSQIVDQAIRLAHDPQACAAMGQHGQAFTKGHEGATQRTLHSLVDAGLLGASI